LQALGFCVPGLSLGEPLVFTPSLVSPQNAGHNDPIVSGATLVDALIWLWRGYPIE